MRRTNPCQGVLKFPTANDLRNPNTQLAQALEAAKYTAADITALADALPANYERALTTSLHLSILILFTLTPLLNHSYAKEEALAVREPLTTRIHNTLTSNPQTPEPTSSW